MNDLLEDIATAGQILEDPKEEISLTEEQKIAVSQAIRCLLGEGENFLTIGGYAGTGKTTVIKSIIDGLRESAREIAVVAFAGKAVEVLRRKEISSAQTLHSLMYKPDKVNGKLEFHKLAFLEVDGVIVDEASMINTQLYDDLLSFHIPVVFIGDHGQLEPIGDNPRLMEKPMVRLEKIHRQAEGSAILWLAHLFRQGKRPKWSTVKSDEIKIVSPAEAKRTCHEYDVVICGFNRSRVAFNEQVRKNRGFRGDLVVGDRLICLRNSKMTGFFNGMMMTVEKIHGEKSVWDSSGPIKALECDVKTEDGNVREKVVVRLAQSEQEVKEYYHKADYIVCDYGFAITCHKAQGSQYGNVLVVEEIWAEKWSWQRWCYTAATRAEKELGWVSQ